MISRKDLTMPLVITSLRSNICPACGGLKNRAQTLCRTDYYRLPAGLRSALYARVGAGYEEALTDALHHLNAETFHTQAVPA